jgi:long-chain acyl-CoA synthetase
MLYDRWQQIVRAHPGEEALIDGRTGRRWTFGQLDDDARHYVPPPSAHTSDPSRDVIFPCGMTAEFVLQTLSAWRNHQLLCPLELGAVPPPLAPLPEDKRVVHLKQTSATSGQARMVLFTAEQLAADAAQIVSTMGLRPDWPNLGCISLAHSYGFSNLVLPLLLHGIPLFLLEAPLPESVRRAVADLGPVTLPAVPALWRAWQEAGVLSPQIRLAISAGAPLPVALEQAIFQGSNLKVHNFYGSTECGGIAYDRSTVPRAEDACIGGAMDQVTLTLATSGCLEVRSAAVGLGYWPEPEPTLRDGSFQTSDLAEIKNELIYLRGRTGDQINVAGRKVAPETIERALRDHPDIAECLVFGVPGADSGRGDLIVACVVTKTKPQGAMEENSWRQFLLSRLPAWQVPKEWRRVENLRPNERGKLSRTQWRTRLGFGP